MLFENDIHSQFIDSIYKNKKLRENQVKNCNHLFVKVDNDSIECVKCGLTNKFNRVLEKYELEYGKLNEFVNNEVELFDKYYGQEKTVDIIESNHVQILYKLAKKIKPFAKEEKIIQIVKILDDIETEVEKEYTFDECDLYYLRKRFKDRTYLESSWDNDRIMEEIIRYAEELKTDVSQLTVFDVETHFDYKISENRIVYALLKIKGRGKAFLKKIKDRK